MSERLQQMPTVNRRGSVCWDTLYTSVFIFLGSNEYSAHRRRAHI